MNKSNTINKNAIIVYENDSVLISCIRTSFSVGAGKSNKKAHKLAAAEH